MHSALYLSSTLLLLPLLVLALPVPPLCPDTDIPCEELKPAGGWSLKAPANGWALREGPLRREARSAEELADADAAPVLKPREYVLEHSIDHSEGSMRRAMDWAFSKAGKESPTALSHAVRALNNRWSTFLHSDLKVVAEPKPIDAAAATTTAIDTTLKEKRWTIPKGQWDILTVIDDSDDEYGPDSDLVSGSTSTELTEGS